MPGLSKSDELHLASLMFGDSSDSDNDSYSSDGSSSDDLTGQPEPEHSQTYSSQDIYDSILSNIISLLIDQRLYWISTVEKHVLYVNKDYISMFEFLVSKINPLNLFKLNKKQKRKINDFFFEENPKENGPSIKDLEIILNDWLNLLDLIKILDYPAKDKLIEIIYRHPAVEALQIDEFKNRKLTPEENTKPPSRTGRYPSSDWRDNLPAVMGSHGKLLKEVRESGTQPMIIRTPGTKNMLMKGAKAGLESMKGKKRGGRKRTKKSGKRTKKSGKRTKKSRKRIKKSRKKR